MHATCPHPCPVITLHRPWWQRWLDLVAERPATRSDAPRRADVRDPSTWKAADLRLLADLPARTRRDIGVPDWVHAPRSAAERAGIDLLHL